MASENKQTPIYCSEKTGSDEAGDGSEAKPYKTALHVSFCCHKYVQGRSFLNCDN